MEIEIQLFFIHFTIGDFFLRYGFWSGFLFMFTHRSFSFGTIQFSLLNITTYKLPKGNGTGSYIYISCNFVCGRVNHRDSAWSGVTATVHYIYIRSIWGDCNSQSKIPINTVAVTLFVDLSISETVLLS